MQKYITRTFKVFYGIKMVPNYQTATFEQQDVTLIDPEEIPHDVVITDQHIVKAKMPIETFFMNSEKVILSKPLNSDAEHEMVKERENVEEQQE